MNELRQRTVLQGDIPAPPTQDFIDHQREFNKTMEKEDNIQNSIITIKIFKRK